MDGLQTKKQVLCEVSSVENGAGVIDMLPDETAEKQKPSSFCLTVCLVQNKLYNG